MKNVDKITEAYKGAFGIEMARSTRERIHWMCSQAKGETVLDVGCSQGVASIVLAREGKSVHGIDICQENIDYANTSLAEEDKSTQANIQFSCTDFMLYSANVKVNYDSIIMGEVLEHLADPERFVVRAQDVLSETGRLVVTVPFGINDYHDHKRTYYLIELYKTIGAVFTVEKVEFLGGWIGIVGNKVIGESIALDEELFARAEKAFFFLEEELREKVRIGKIDAIANQDRAKQWQEKAEENLTVSNQWRGKAEENLAKSNQWEHKAEENLVSLNQWKEKAEENLQTLSYWKGRALENSIYLDQEKQKNLESNQQKDKLENIISSLKNDINSLKNQITQIGKKYDTLAKSKLGRIQVSIWKRRTEKKYKANKMSFKERIKQIAKKSSLLVFLVRKLRGQKTNISEVKQEIKPIEKAAEPNVTPSYDMDFLKRIEHRLNQIPTSSEGRYYRKHDHKLAVITDEFMFNTFKDVAENVVPLHPESWQEQVLGSDIMLFISGWRGIAEEWLNVANKNSEKSKLAIEIIEHCKQSGIPTVFYSIEDPPNYANFIGIAQKCDYVFTTADEIKDRYIQDCGHDKVHSLMMGINPLFHNPVGSCSEVKLNGVIFSGSWYDRYPERKKDMCIVFDGVLSSGRGLKIIDRNLHRNMPEYQFPIKYSSFISPAVPHVLLQKVHKLYDWAINFNTVKESQTMFANRVFELEATGNLILSNYSVGVNSHLPIIYTVQNSEEVTRILDSLSDDEIQERKAVGIRHAMTGHTCFDRYAEILDIIGFPALSQGRNVAVVVKELTSAVKTQFERQTYPYKTLITKDKLQECYADYDIITFFSEGMEYGAFYLEDMTNAFKYTDCDYITKDSYYMGNGLIKGRQHDFVSSISSKYCTVFWAGVFDAQTLLNLPEGSVEMPKGYSADCLQFNMCQRATQKPTKNYKMSVILPVYNNGLHLYGKAFGSLLRSSMFSDMEIILVDDGSTDGISEHYVRYFEERYDNVRTFFFGDGGSGSASRARNKGVEMTTTDYVTFLDPDNEAIADGYARLYETAINGEYDLTIGNIQIFLEKETEMGNYHRAFMQKYGSDIVEGSKAELLKKIAFEGMSIQAMLIEKSLIVENELTQVVGAAGQDTLFSIQLMANAKRIKVIDVPIHIYYGRVAGSTVNSVGKRYFQKQLLLEQVQLPWLLEAGMLQDYMDTRFNRFFRNWILERLSHCNPEEAVESRKTVFEIFMLYRDFYNGKDEKINEFVKSCSTKV